MRYINYNDYELIYLIQEGSEKALEQLYNKYTTFIVMTIQKTYVYGDKRNDLYQEGLMMLHTAIQSYNPLFTISFFSYFSILFKRRVYHLVKNDYYTPLVFMEDPNQYSDSNIKTKSYLYRPEQLFEDEMLVLFYKEYFIEGLSFLGFAQKYQIDIQKLYYYKTKVVKHLKKILTNT